MLLVYTDSIQAKIGDCKWSRAYGMDQTGFKYGRPLLSRLSLSRITAYLEEKI